MITGKLAEKKFWPVVERKLRQQYGQRCKITLPHRLRIKLPSGKIVYIERTWYDVLVIEPAYDDVLVPSHGKEIDVETPGLHCIEIKFSEKEKPHGFGAFTLGEWVTAYLAHVSKRYTYELYFVSQIKGSSEVRIDNIPVTEKVLQDMLFYPQTKFYYYSWFLKENLQSRLTSHVPSTRKRHRVGPAVQEINEKLITILYSFVEKK